MTTRRGEEAALDQLNEIIEAVRDGSLLSDLDLETLSALLEQSGIVKLDDGQTLFHQGDPGDAAYLVVTGTVEVVVETRLGEVTVATIGPREMVGEIAIFTDLKRTATVRAKGPALLVRVERARMASTIASNPSASAGLIGAMGRRIDALNRPLVLLTLAAQALERDDGDSETLVRIADDFQDIGPFARSFQKLVREMDGKQARRHEMAVSARLQQSILPRPLSLGPKWDMAAFMRPAQFVGGDFYDWFLTEDGRVILLVADVSGKGMPAALFMAVSRTLIRASVLAGGSIEAALTSVNRQIEAENDESMFVTVFLSELDLASGKLRYVNAGHCEGWLRRADRHLTALGTTGPAVALRANATFRAETVDLQPGDLLFLSSDGVNEAFSAREELFGDERLKRVLQHHLPVSAKHALDAVATAVATFTAGAQQSDDITCLALLRS
jgi:serine phosphatase RsbU (regulator of sigma subunit)